MKYIPIFLFLSSCQFLTSPEAIEIEEEILVEILREVIEEVQEE